MDRKLVIFCVLFLVSLVPAFNALLASDQVGLAPKTMHHKLISGSEELPLSSAIKGNLGASRSPGICIGGTRYDYQHNGSMGRQVVFTYEGTDKFCGIHFVWMALKPQACTDPNYPTYRHIRYNAIDCGGSVIHGTCFCGGKAIPEAYGGYPSLDVDHYGGAVPALHYGPIVDDYEAYVYHDIGPPLGAWVSEQNTGPIDSDPQPNCEGIITGNYELGSPSSQYIWPKVEFDVCGDDSIFHKVTTESPPEAAPFGEIQSFIYYRDIWHPGPPPAIIVPTCGMFVDSVYCISGVVRQNPLSDEVAIAWGHPIHYDGDPNDPCGATQAQNDVYVWYSYDCGVTWDPGDKINITDYTDGGNIPVDQCPHLFYTDLSAVYDHEGTLHVVWGTPIRDGCTTLYASRIWHWDDGRGCITLVYDASRPRFFNDTGGWNVSTAKMSVTECFVDGGTRFYVQFTRFGAHPSADGDTATDVSAGGFNNGDIFIVGSSDAGVTWSAAVNLTNTYTPDCDPGDCESEHWSSVAKYSNDSVYIEYIEDKDAGGLPQTEGEQTDNPVRYIAHECFTIEPFCGMATTPLEVNATIAPEGEEGCTAPLADTFDITLTNTGNQTVNYSVSETSTWLNILGTASGSITAGCNAVATVTVEVGPYGPEGSYTHNMSISYDCGGTPESFDLPVNLYVHCFPPEYEIISTACWSLAVWNYGNAGGDEPGTEGQMYWFPPTEAAFMFDHSFIVTNAANPGETYFSIFGGSDSNASFEALAKLEVVELPSEGYTYASGAWLAPDTSLAGTFSAFLPSHPETCAVMECFSVCNETDAPITIHVGAAIDWDIPDGEGGSNNQVDVDVLREEIYVFGPPGTTEEDYIGTAAFDDPIVGAIALENDEWVYPNSGYVPSELGNLLTTHTGFLAVSPDTLQDMNAVYVVAQNLVLEPGFCEDFDMVMASSITGIVDLQERIDRAKDWLEHRDSTFFDLAVEAEPTDQIYDNTDGYRPRDGMGADILGTNWHEIRPTFSTNWTVFSSIDRDSNDELSEGDILALQTGVLTQRLIRIFRITRTVILEASGTPDRYLEQTCWIGDPSDDLPTKDLGKVQFHEVYPTFCDEYQLSLLKDTDTKDILDYCDRVTAENEDKEWQRVYHVKDVRIDIIAHVVSIGDADGSAAIDIDDVVYLIAYIFSGGPAPVPHPVAAGDPDCSCAVDIDDVVYLIAYIFSGGPPPCLDTEWIDACVPYTPPME